MLGYAVYNYAYYLFGAALNAFFALYVVALPLAVLALILLLSQIDVTVVAASFRSSTPVRMIGGYLAFVGIGLGSVWLIMWGAYAFAGRPTPIEPEAFKLVAALDVSIMATALTFGGVLLWRRNAWGYVLAVIAGIQASLYRSCCRSTRPSRSIAVLWKLPASFSFGVTRLQASLHTPRR